MPPRRFTVVRTGGFDPENPRPLPPIEQDDPATLQSPPPLHVASEPRAEVGAFPSLEAFEAHVRAEERERCAALVGRLAAQVADTATACEATTKYREEAVVMRQVEAHLSGAAESIRGLR